MSATVSRWSRRYVLTSVFFLICWQIGILLDVPRQTEVVFGLFGFVFHMIFGKAYALIPSYFDSSLDFVHAPKIQFPFVTGGTAGLAIASLGEGPVWLGIAGIVLWCVGIVVFVGALLRTIGSALLEGETGTGEHNAERRSVDRLANYFVPVAFLYLFVGSYEMAAFHGLFPPLFDGLHAQSAHLLATGTATLLVFALGFRLLPRFLVVHPPEWAVRIVLPTAALGPAFIAAGITNPRLLLIGALLETTAVCLFALVFFHMFVRSERRRIGFYGVLAGMASGVAGVVLGLSFAVHSVSVTLTTLHLRFNLLGFLGLTIIGVAYQFYPPAVGEFPGSTDRTALISIVGITLGLFFHAVAVFGGIESLLTIGSLLTLGGSILYAYLISSAFVANS